MSDYIRLKKGLDLPISGRALYRVTKVVKPDVVALQPSDFRGLVPRLLVKEGDAVKAGTPLFADKANSAIVFSSPVSGTVESVVRGEKRKLLAVRVKADGKDESVRFDVPKEASFTKENVTKALLESGLWPCIKQRPYNVIADPGISPKSIFISAMPTAPLSADLDYTLAKDLSAVQLGFAALAKLTTGGVHVSLAADNYAGSEFHKMKGVIFHKFDGPHPAGNVGVQINRISPINKGEVVWTVDMTSVAAIGRLFKNGVYDTHRLVAVAGPAVKNPSYVEVPQGVAISELTDMFEEGDVRIISGDVLSGKRVAADGFLGFFDNFVTVLEEGNYSEMFGWCKPFRFQKFSASRSYWSWFAGLSKYEWSQFLPSFITRHKDYDMDTNLNGGVRAFVFSDVYGKVLPMDILPVYLFKAILAGDIEKMEELGIYEIVEEDVALCEFVDPSKIDIQQIVSDGIDLMLKEMA